MRARERRERLTSSQELARGRLGHRVDELDPPAHGPRGQRALGSNRAESEGEDAPLELLVVRDLVLHPRLDRRRRVRLGLALARKDDCEREPLLVSFASSEERETGEGDALYARGYSVCWSSFHTPMTAQSATNGHSRRTASSSAGGTWKPLTLINSFKRSVM